jgi:hypothetical protein
VVAVVGFFVVFVAPFLEMERRRRKRKEEEKWEGASWGCRWRCRSAHAWGGRRYV